MEWQNVSCDNDFRKFAHIKRFQLAQLNVNWSVMGKLSLCCARRCTYISDNDSLELKHRRSCKNLECVFDSTLFLSGDVNGIFAVN